MHPIRWMLLFTALTALEPPLAAQLYPQGSQVISYFPHLVAGGPASASWTTSLIFVNPHQSSAGTATAYFYDDNGVPLALDFGSGSASTLSFSVAAQGSVALKTVTGQSAIASGWAVVLSSLPLQGVVQYTLSSGGVSEQSVAVQATPASRLFRSPATRDTGVAVANPYSVSTTLSVVAIDTAGNTVTNTFVTVPANGHRAFNLSQVFPNLPAAFQGSVLVNGPSYFVALTLSVNGAALASYPPSGLNWPSSQNEIIYKVWSEVLNQAAQLVTLSPPPKLVIDSTTTSINAFASVSANEVHFFLNLAELISDSESELAFLLGHELGHIIQGKVGLQLVGSNQELDADEYGMLLGLGAGYDPYGAAGALAKLSMAAGSGGLLSSNFDNIQLAAGTDLHTVFNNRLSLLFQSMQSLCASTPQRQSACNSYKNGVHPDLPGAAPLIAHPIPRPSPSRGNLPRLDPN